MPFIPDTLTEEKSSFIPEAVENKTSFVPENSSFVPDQPKKGFIDRLLPKETRFKKYVTGGYVDEMMSASEKIPSSFLPLTITPAFDIEPIKTIRKAEQDLQRKLIGMAAAAPLDPTTPLFGVTGFIKSPIKKAIAEVGAVVAGAMARKGTLEEKTASAGIQAGVITAMNLLPLRGKLKITPKLTPEVTPTPIPKGFKPESTFIPGRGATITEAIAGAKEGAQILKEQIPKSQTEAWENYLGQKFKPTKQPKVTPTPTIPEVSQGGTIAPTEGNFVLKGTSDVFKLVSSDKDEVVLRDLKTGHEYPVKQSDFKNVYKSVAPTGEGKVAKEQWQIENEEIRGSIDNIKNDISKLIGEDSAALLKSVGINNENDVFGVLSWQKMKRYTFSTEDNIKNIYNYFAKKSEKPLLTHIDYGKDLDNPMKNMSGRIEGGGNLDPGIAEKTKIVLSKLHQSIDRELSTPTEGKVLNIGDKVDYTNDLGKTRRLTIIDKDNTSYKLSSKQGATKEDLGIWVSKDKLSSTEGKVEKHYEYHLSESPDLVEGKTFAEQTTKQSGKRGGEKGLVYTTQQPAMWQTQMNREFPNAPEAKNIYLVEVKNPSKEAGYYGQESVSPSNEVRVVKKIGNVDEWGDKPISISDLETRKNKLLSTPTEGKVIPQKISTLQGKGGFVHIPEELPQAVKEASENALISGAAKVGLQPKYAPINFNMERINAPEDIKAGIMEWHAMNKPELEADYLRFKQGNFIKNLEKEAALADVDVKQILRDKKYNINTPQGSRDLFIDTMVLRNYKLQKQSEVTSLAQKLADPAIDEATKQKLNLDLFQLNSEYMAVSIGVQRKAQFTGQLMNVFKGIAKAQDYPTAERLDIIAKIIAKDTNITVDQAKRFIEMAGKANLHDPLQIANVLKEIKSTKNLNSDLLWGYLYNNVLSGVGAHEANAVGNTMSLLANELIRAPSIGLEKMWAGVRGKPSEATFRELLPAYMGLKKGFKEAIPKAWEIMRTGISPDDFLEPSKWETAKFEAAALHPDPRVRAAALPLNFFLRALKASDAMFKGMLFSAEKEARIIRKSYQLGAKSKLDILQKSTEVRNNLSQHSDIIQGAKTYSEFGTFNQKADWVTRHLEQIKQHSALSRALVTPILPFMRIASNLFRQSITSWNLPGAFIKGEEGTRIERSTKIIRALMGTSLLAYGAMKYMNKEMTLDTPQGQAKRLSFLAQNKQPFSLVATEGGDTKYYPLRRFEPFVHPFMAGAIIAKNIEEGKLNEEQAMEIISDMGQDIGRYYITSTYMLGLSNFFNMFERSGASERKVNDFISSSASAFIPYTGLLRNLSQSIDTKIRNPQTIPQKITSSLPFISRNIPARTDVFGQEQERIGGRLGAFSFWKPSTQKKDPVYQELDKLDRPVGFPSKKFAGVKLTQEEYNQYLQSFRPETKKTLEIMFQEDGYKSLSAKDKKNKIDKVLEKASKQPRTDMIYNKATEKINKLKTTQEKVDYIMDLYTKDDISEKMSRILLEDIDGE